MNIRSLTRGDGAVIGAAVLLLISSFLSFYTVDVGLSDTTVDTNAWESALFPLLPSVHLMGLIAAALIVGARFLPAGRKVLGITLDQWGTVLAVSAAWAALWSLFRAGENIGLGVGAYLSVLFTLALAVGAVLTAQGLPVLKAPLLPAPRPQQPQPHGGPGAPVGPGQGYPGMQQGQQGGYGYPGQVSAPDPSYGGGQQPYGAPAPQAGSGPQQGGQPGAQPPAPEFTAFWFAVPVARPLFPEDGSPTPIAELTPGTWYLAVDQRDTALIAQTQDGRRGILQDTTGIQRG